MDILGINAQIEEVKRQRKQLSAEKKKKEDKIKEGEGLFDGLTNFRKQSSNAIGDFESKLSAKCDKYPGNFGKYYKRKIQSALKDSKAYEADNMISDAITSVKNSIFDLDGVVANLKNKIDGLNNLLKQLGDMLEDAQEAIEDAFSGGKN